MKYLRIWGFIALAVAVIGGVLGLHQSASTALAPGRPSVKAIEPGTVSLDWNDVPGASGYELRYRDSEWKILPHGDVDVTMEGSSAVVRSLPGGSEYAFSVRARTPVGYRSNWSDPVFPVPLPARVSPTRGLPATPSNLKVTKRERDSVALEWQAVNAADSYQVAYWHTSDAGEDWVILPDEGIQVLLDVYSGTGATVSRLPGLPEGVHDFAVRAVNAEGVSSWSEVVQAPGQVVLAWPEVPAAHTYEILFWYDLETVSEEWVVLPTEDIDVSLDGSQALVDFGPDPSDRSDRLLNFSVRALNALSESPWSSVVAVGPVLQVPAALTGRLLEDGAISLDWPDVPVVDTYEVRFLLGGSSGSQWVILPASGIEVSFDGSGARLEQLPHYADYFLQVRAIKEHSLPSDWSEIFAITRQTGQPGTTVQTTSVAGTPPGTGTTSTESPTDTEASPQTGPGSGEGPLGGAPTLETVATPTPTPTPRARRSGGGGGGGSQPEPTPQPRVWLTGLPSKLEVGEMRTITLMHEGIRAPDGTATLGVIPANLEFSCPSNKCNFAIRYYDEELDKKYGPGEDASGLCSGASGAYAELLSQRNHAKFHIIGCKKGSDTDVFLDTNVAGSGVQKNIEVVPRSGE